MSPRRVLLVEDSEFDAILAKELLRDHDVEHVATFAAALDAVARTNYDVALLDMQLPDASGPALVGRLAKRAPQLAIVVLTGSVAGDPSAHEALAHGAQDWLRKDGLDPLRLRRTIDYAIERKAHASGLAQSEERFAQLADNTQIIFIIFNADLSQVLYVNAAYDRVTGVNRDHLKTDPTAWMHLVHPDDRPLVRDAIERLTRGEGPLDLRCRIRRPDTTLRWLHVRGFTIRDARGEIYRVAATVDDVTQLHESEARLAAANRSLHGILETAGEGICGLGPDGRITFANRLAAQMLGYEPAWLIGQSAHALFHAPTAKVKAHAANECPIEQVLRDGKTRQVEDDVFRTIKGDALHVACVTSARVDGDHIEGAVVVFADITERLRAQDALARAEARFRGIFLGSRSRITLTDKDGTILATNKPTDAGEPDLTIGTPIWASVPADPTAQEKLRSWVQQAREGRAIRDIIELSNHASIRDVAVTPLGPPGAPTEILWESRDVTELHVARREAEDAKTRLEELQRFRVQLMNNIAHDMGTPLMVMQLRLDALAQAPPTPEGGRVLDARTLHSLLAAGQQLSVLTRDLRDVSLMEAGKFRLHLSDVDLADVARATCADLADIAQRAGVQLVADIPDEPLPVRGDEPRLVQAMTNLLTNAIKFSPPKAEVRVRLSRHADRVRADVKDAGPGVPPDARERLFKPFSQVHVDLRAQKGTGLGLYIVRGIARAHGGDVHLVESEPGHGAMFRIELPEARTS